MGDLDEGDDSPEVLHKDPAGNVGVHGVKPRFHIKLGFPVIITNVLIVGNP